MQLLRVENTKKSLSWEGDTRLVALRPRTTALCALAFQIRGNSHAQPVSDLGISVRGIPPQEGTVPLKSLRVLFTLHHDRPYALTSRLHNNDAMLGVKTSRAARTCCAGRAHWRSASQSVHGPGPARRYGMQGWPAGCMLGDGARGRCHVWPPTRLGALLWRHMHFLRSITGRKNQNCKKRQWCLWRFMCPLSMHQFIEISISVQETRSWGGLKRGTVPLMRGYFSLCITIYRRKNQNCKRRQWFLWRFMCPLSMHQFIEISICALEKKKHFDVERPVKVCAPTGLPVHRRRNYRAN